MASNDAIAHAVYNEDYLAYTKGGYDAEFDWISPSRDWPPQSIVKSVK